MQNHNQKRNVALLFAVTMAMTPAYSVNMPKISAPSKGQIATVAAAVVVGSLLQAHADGKLNDPKAFVSAKLAQIKHVVAPTYTKGMAPTGLAQRAADVVTSNKTVIASLVAGLVIAATQDKAARKIQRFFKNRSGLKAVLALQAEAVKAAQDAQPKNADGNVVPLTDEERNAAIKAFGAGRATTVMATLVSGSTPAVVEVKDKDGNVTTAEQAGVAVEAPLTKLQRKLRFVNARAKKAKEATPKREAAFANTESRASKKETGKVKRTAEETAALVATYPTKKATVVVPGYGARALSAVTSAPGKALGLTAALGFGAWRLLSSAASSVVGGGASAAVNETLAETLTETLAATPLPSPAALVSAVVSASETVVGSATV